MSPRGISIGGSGFKANETALVLSFGQTRTVSSYQMDQRHSIVPLLLAMCIRVKYQWSRVLRLRLYNDLLPPSTSLSELTKPNILLLLIGPSTRLTSHDGTGR